MDVSTQLQIAFSVIGGLGIFLLGMRNLSDGLQTIGGSRLRKLIASVTNNRILATVVGIVVTSIIQSSSITSVMVVGFVNTGFMTLTQAIGVIMGANIGTTMTAWILALKIGKYGLPILGAAALVHLFSRRERMRYWALVILGLGMVFFGLELMKDGFKPIRSAPGFLEWFHAFTADSYFGVLKCAAVGCVLTLIVQSSSATIGITIGLASTGVITFPTAAALVLGENIGTTITAFLASLGATTNAKRAAYAHVIFNVLGVLWITAIFPVYLHFIETAIVTDPGRMVLVDGVETFPRITAGIASVHSIFNIANTILFLPLIPLLAKLLERIVPERRAPEEPHLTSLDIRLFESPPMGIEQSRVEIMRMAEVAGEMMDYLYQTLGDEANEEQMEAKVLHREEVLDIMQKEVVVFLTDMLSGNVSHDVIDHGRRQLRMADEYESVGDYARSIVKLHRRLHQNDIHFTPQGWNELRELHNAVKQCMALVAEGYRDNHPELIAKIHTQGKMIKKKSRQFRDNHLQRMSDEGVNPLSSVLFCDTLHAYQKVNAHLMNIAEAYAE